MSHRLRESLRYIVPARNVLSLSRHHRHREEIAAVSVGWFRDKKFDQDFVDRAPGLGLAGNYRVVQTEVAQSLMALDTCVGQRGVFIAAEREHGLVHMCTVEYVE